MAGGEFAVDEWVERQMTQRQQGVGVDRAVPRFYIDYVENKSESRKAGKKVYDEIEMVEIRKPGERNTIPVVPVTDAHRARWPEQYERFRRGEDQHVVEGTPIEKWGALNPAQTKLFKENDILSVDQLAALPDGALKVVGMGAVRLRREAKEFVEIRDGHANTVALTEQNAYLTEQVAELTEKVDRLMAENEAMASVANVQAAQVKKAPVRRRKK
jgi:hypothetical protein